MKEYYAHYTNKLYSLDEINYIKFKTVLKYTKACRKLDRFMSNLIELMLKFLTKATSGTNGFMMNSIKQLMKK